MVSPSLHPSYGGVSQICHSMIPRGLGSAGLGDFENLFQTEQLNNCRIREGKFHLALHGVMGWESLGSLD